MAIIEIRPEGEYEIGVGEDLDGATYVAITLPDGDGGDPVQLTFRLPAFVTFADWVSMVADKLVNEQAGNPDPD